MAETPPLSFLEGQVQEGATPTRETVFLHMYTHALKRGAVLSPFDRELLAQACELDPQATEKKLAKWLPTNDAREMLASYSVTVGKTQDYHYDQTLGETPYSSTRTEKILRDTLTIAAEKGLIPPVKEVVVDPRLLSFDEDTPAPSSVRKPAVPRSNSQPTLPEQPPASSNPSPNEGDEPLPEFVKTMLVGRQLELYTLLENEPGLSTAELAARMKITIDNVYTIKSNIKASLKKLRAAVNAAATNSFAGVDTRKDDSASLKNDVLPDPPSDPTPPPLPPEPPVDFASAFPPEGATRLYAGALVPRMRARASAYSQPATVDTRKNEGPKLDPKEILYNVEITDFISMVLRGHPAIDKICPRLVDRLSSIQRRILQDTIAKIQRYPTPADRATLYAWYPEQDEYDNAVVAIVIEALKQPNRMLGIQVFASDPGTAKDLMDLYDMLKALYRPVAA